MGLNLVRKNEEDITYRDIAEDLTWLNDALLLSGYERFEPIPHSQYGDDLIRALASRINALEADDSSELPVIFDQALRWFAKSEGRRGAESTTPESIAALLVELAAPTHGRVIDPCCGCAGLLLRAQRYARTKKADETLDLYGQDADAGIRKLAQMNLVASGIQADLGERAADSLVYDIFPTLKADFVLANPPFNLPGTPGTVIHDEKQWPFGAPHANHQNFPWIQHFIKHLSPTGLAVFTSPSGSLTGTLYGEAKIRERIVRADLVDCVIGLPKGLFESSRIPACIWILAKDKSDESIDALRPHRGETLFIDARELAKTAKRRGGQLEPAEITQIASTYHAWKSLKPRSKYADVPGFCQRVRLEEIVLQGFDLSPSRYLELSTPEPAASMLDERIREFKLQLVDQLNTSARLDAEIHERLRRLPDDL